MGDLIQCAGRNMTEVVLRRCKKCGSPLETELNGKRVWVTGHTEDICDGLVREELRKTAIGIGGVALATAAPGFVFGERKLDISLRSNDYDRFVERIDRGPQA
jgi:hypothetical protein